ERLRAERPELHHALLHNHGADQETDQRDDRQGAKAGVVEMMKERGDAEARGLLEQPQEARRDLAEKRGELKRILPHAGHALGRVVDDLPDRVGLFDLGALGLTSAMHLLDQDAEVFRGAGVARTQAALLPGPGGTLEE